MSAPNDRDPRADTPPAGSDPISKRIGADPQALSASEFRTLVHELQVHQVELEVQNEELRRAQLALAQSRDHFADLFDFAPVGFLTLSRNGTIRNANLTAATLLGLGRQQLIRDRITRFVAPESQDDWHFHRRAVFESDTRQTCELMFRREDGARWSVRLESIAYPPSPNPESCRTALIDVTRERELGRLAIEAARLERMVEHLPAGAAYVEHDHVQLNRAAEAITGYSRAQLDSLDKWFGLLHGENAATARADHEKRRAHRFPDTIELSLRRADGEQRIVEFAGHRFDEVEIWILHDISDRRIAELARLENEERLRAVFDSAADAIVTIDSSGRIDRANPATERMFGYPALELIGCNVNCLVPSGRPGDPVHDLARYMTSRGMSITERRRELVGLRRDGTRFPIELTVSAADHLDLFTGTLRDLSERRRYEALIAEEATAEQERIGRDLHDTVGQDLAALALAADRDCQRAGPGPTGERLGELAGGIRGALEGVRAAVRGLTRPASDYETLVLALEELAGSTHRRRGVACHVRVAGDGRLSAEQAHNLFRIAWEAVSNAVRHARSEEITIDVGGAPERILVQVSDNGVGFSDTGRSTGVGIRVMRKRARTIGAEFSIESRPGQGTTVSLELRSRETGVTEEAAVDSRDDRR